VNDVAAENSEENPLGFDVTRAHSARVYNFWLGGKDNFAVDRKAAEDALAANPGMIHAIRANRAFLVRTVRYLAGEEAIRQFLDIGTGLPTANNTHEIAQSVAPESRIVYADNDPMVLAHARALLTSSREGNAPIWTPTCGTRTRSWPRRRGRWTLASPSRSFCSASCNRSRTMTTRTAPSPGWWTRCRRAAFLRSRTLPRTWTRGLPPRRRAA
jgi:hypothetical protein